MPSFEQPTQEQVEAAVQRMKSPEFAAYFLSRLQNPLWVGPLHDKGIFAYPPPPIRMEGGHVGFPHWPASTYLAQMAKHVPADVAAILANLKTENTRVIGDIVAAALAMPADDAANLVTVISRAAHGHMLSWIYYKDAGALCARLAEEGRHQDALTLAEALFAPEFEPGDEQPRRQDEHFYAIALRQTVAALAGREPVAFLSRLCEWLKASVEAKRTTDIDSGRDYSYLWRPAVEEHGQNLRHDFAAVMAGFVREGFETAIREGGLTLNDALGILGRYRYLIFDRVRIHLINEFAEKEPELARRTMLDRQLFDDPQYKHEYARLVGRRLGLLIGDEEDRWFAWVDEGPNKDDFKRSVTAEQGRDPTEEEWQARKDYWQFQKLHCVRNHLHSVRRTFYDAMLAQHGAPELAEFNTYVSTGWGTSSPMKLDDLAGLTFAQAVEKVSSWRSEEHRLRGPDVEGLADTFKEYVATNPEVFSQDAEVLIGRPAIHVRIFITRVAEAIKAGCELDVSPLLKLSRWVLKRPLDERTTPEQGGGALVDRDWQWTRDEIAQLTKNICEAKDEEVARYPLRLREEIWEIVEALLRDRAESYIIHDPSRDDPRLEDYLTLGINSPRGKALEAGLEYARWVANHIKEPGGDRKTVPGGFEAMTEVRGMLEWQIADENRAREALAVIGSRLGLIYWIDQGWLGANVEQLFQLRGIEGSPPSVDGWAAWNAFLVWIRPHVEFYRLFKGQFVYAVEQSTTVTVAEQAREGPMHHLGEHLVLLYAWGDLDLVDDDGLLMRFLTGAHPSLRRHAIEFGGRVLQDNEQLPAAMVERLMRLWDVYWGGEGKEDLRKKPDALLFGLWFSSGQLPEQWAIERLEDFVAVTPTPEPDHAIAEQLASTASIDAVRAVRILDRMVRNDTEGWRVHGWLDPARKVLEAAMKAGGDANRQAKSIIDYLGRRGHASFGDLLRARNVVE